MSEEYLDAVNTFFQERMKSQSNKKYKHCDGCKDEKQFIIKKDKLIYSCGSKSGKCGPQLTIDLERNVYFPDMKHDIYQSNDQYDFSNKLDDIYTKEELEEKQTINKQRKNLLKYNQKLFTKINNHKKREESIKKLHNDRINYKKELSLLKEKIETEADIHKKEVLQREYIQLNIRMNNEYKQMLELNNPIHNFIPIFQGKVTKEYDKYEPEPMPEPLLSQGDNIMWLDSGKETYGQIDSIKDEHSVNILFEGSIITKSMKDITKV